MDVLQTNSNNLKPHAVSFRPVSQSSRSPHIFAEKRQRAAEQSGIRPRRSALELCVNSQEKKKLRGVKLSPLGRRAGRRNPPLCSRLQLNENIIANHHGGGDRHRINRDENHPRPHSWNRAVREIMIKKSALSFI